jgi:hypothetical protein
MVKGIFSATLFGGIIVWMWMFISWTVLPWHCSALKRFENESTVQEVISAVAKEDGIYTIPALCKQDLPDPDQILEEIQQEELKTSKIIVMSINSSGFTPSSIIPHVVSLLTNIACALFVSLIVMLMAASGYGWKLFAITLIGLIAGIYAEVPLWIWMGFPLHNALIGIADLVISWFLAGIVMAGLIRPRHQVS